MNIKKIIREEIKDFDWAKGPFNPWLEYDAIIFDIEPTEEEVNKYIQMALDTREIANAHEWTEEERETDIEQIINNSYLGLYKNHGEVIPHLGYPIDNAYKNDNSILYSEFTNIWI
jgi:hypothetical protein